MGVDVFFVISGYLMTLTIWKGIGQLKRPENSLKSGIKEATNFLLTFYTRRIIRLLPAAFVLLVFVLAAVYLIGSSKIQIETTRQILASILLIQNWYLADQSVDYLGADAEATAVQHFWSLSVEEQFYLIWPVLLILIGYSAYRINKNRNKSEYKPFFSYGNLLPLLAITLFTICSFVYCLKCTNDSPAKAYFVTPARIWELSMGGIIVFLPILNNRSVRFLLPWIGLAMILYPVINWGGAGFPGWRALIPTLGTALIIWGGIPTERNKNGNPKTSYFSFSNLSRFQPFQFFGNISYSLYLWHWPIIVFAPAVLSIELTGKDAALSLYHLILFLISVGAAWISYKYVELPTKQIKVHKGNTPKVWGFAALCFLLVIGPAKMIELNAVDFSANIVQKAFRRALDPNDIGFGARATQHRGKNDVSSNPFGHIDRAWAPFASAHVHGTIDGSERGVDLSSSITYTCNTKSKGSPAIIGEFGDVKSDKILLVLGDSFSKHWYPAIDIAARKLGYKVIAANSIYSNGSLFEIGNEFGEKWLYKEGTTISVPRSNARFKWIRNNLWKKADAIIIGISPECFTQTHKSPQSLRDAPSRLAQTLEEIYKQTGKKAILIQSPPTKGDSIDRQGNILGINLGEMIWNDTKKSNKSFRNTKLRMDRTYDALVKVGASDSFHYLKVEDIFLDEEGNAHTHIGGIPVFFDGGHINTLFSASAGEYFAEKLGALLNSQDTQKINKSWVPVKGFNFGFWSEESVDNLAPWWHLRSRGCEIQKEADGGLKIGFPKVERLYLSLGSLNFDLPCKGESFWPCERNTAYQFRGKITIVSGNPKIKIWVIEYSEKRLAHKVYDVGPGNFDFTYDITEPARSLRLAIRFSGEGEVILSPIKVYSSPIRRR